MSLPLNPKVNPLNYGRRTDEIIDQIIGWITAEEPLTERVLEGFGPAGDPAHLVIAQYKKRDLHPRPAGALSTGELTT